MEKKLKEILKRFENPYLNISLVPKNLNPSKEILFHLAVGELGQTKKSYTGPKLSKLINEAYLKD